MKRVPEMWKMIYLKKQYCACFYRKVWEEHLTSNFSQGHLNETGDIWPLVWGQGRGHWAPLLSRPSLTDESTVIRQTSLSQRSCCSTAESHVIKQFVVGVAVVVSRTAVHWVCWLLTTLSLVFVVTTILSVNFFCLFLHDLTNRTWISCKECETQLPLVAVENI